MIIWPYRSMYEAVSDWAMAMMMLGFGRAYIEPAIVRQMDGWR